MRKEFAKTSNVRAFLDAMTRLKSRAEGIPGMALVYGRPGLGKTKTALWWTLQDQSNAIFVRTKKLMTGRWLLEEIAAELGEAPKNKVSELYRQVRDRLIDNPRTVIVDEVDYLAYDARVIETLRDIHDDTDVPMVFIGMQEADRKLRRYTHLFSRFSEVVLFDKLTLADVVSIAEQICETKISKDGTAFIHRESDGFRRIMVWLYRAEHLARVNGLKEVTAAHLEGWK
jgi:DNA transposition AAA+ family ATPase